MPTTRPASRISRHASISRFSSNGSPTCTLGRLSSSSPSSPKPADARTLAPPMPSRPVDEPNSTARLPGPGGPGQHEPVVREQPEAEHVDQRVVLIGGVEDDLAADGRHADGVAVAGNAGHDAFGDPAAAGVVERAEPQRIHEGDRAGADREDVAQDARRRRWPRPGRARWPTGGCGSRCGRRRRCRRRRRPRRRPRPGRPARAAPRSEAAAGGCATTCRSSARTTSPSTWPARGGSAAGRGSARWRRPRRR